ncbi:MAG: hypothetical protein AAGG01_20310 [Planctomycetota bacterium]
MTIEYCDPEGFRWHVAQVLRIAFGGMATVRAVERPSGALKVNDVIAAPSTVAAWHRWGWTSSSSSTLELTEQGQRVAAGDAQAVGLFDCSLRAELLPSPVTKRTSVTRSRPLQESLTARGSS